MNILGVSAFYHDAAAALIKDGAIVAAAQEERFTREKHDPRFPLHALKYCCEAGGVGASSIDHVVFYEKPLRKFDRIVRSFVQTSPGYSAYHWPAKLLIDSCRLMFQRNTYRRTLR